MNANFERLIARSGKYSLPYLIHLHSEDNTISMRYVNSRSDIEFEGNTYLSGSFSYEANPSEKGFNGGGKLDITVKENQVIQLIETKKKIVLDVIGAIREKNNIQKLTKYKHHYGKIDGDKKSVIFTFDKDDRQDMTFPTMIWSGLNNHGNN